MEDCGGVFAAAALVFLPGAAGAGSAAGNLGGVGWFRLGWFFGGSFDFGLFCCGWLFLPVGLKAAEFGQGTAHDAVGLGAGAVDGGLGAEEIPIKQGIFGGSVSEGGFDFGAAAKSPGRADYFGGEHGLEGAMGAHVVPEGGGECVVFFGFAGLDAVLCGEQAKTTGVLGGAGAAFGGPGAGGVLRVFAICVELSFRCHFGMPFRFDGGMAGSGKRRGAGWVLAVSY
jgi:hypothetical protein